MSESGPSTREKAAFVAGLAVLAFLFGSAVQIKGCFPGPQLEQAWHQADQLTRNPRPHFLVPKTFDREGVRAPQPDRVQPGLNLVSAVWKGEKRWRPGLRLIDNDGELVHEWRVDAREIFDDPSVADRVNKDLKYSNPGEFYLFPERGDVLLNFGYVGLARLDACGEVVWSLPALSHHSVHRADDGTFWVPASSSERHVEIPGHEERMPGFKGKKEAKGVYLDRLVNVSPDGEVLREINVLDVLYRNGLDRHVVKSYQARIQDNEPPPEDITHVNDVEPLDGDMAEAYPLFERGDLMVSVRNLDLVIVFDPETKKVKWHVSEPLIQQHDPDFLGDGRIAVFDNNRDGTDRGTRLGGSRIVAIEPATGKTDVLFPTEESEQFYTKVGGRWQMLENGNLLMAETKTGRLLEVDSSGRSVWEWVHPAYDGMVSEVTRVTRHDLTGREVADWKCGSDS